ncbi:hypothetical protein V8E36_009785 [Tilletia maclaganii]
MYSKPGQPHTTTTTTTTIITLELGSRPVMACPPLSPARPPIVVPQPPAQPTTDILSPSSHFLSPTLTVPLSPLPLLPPDVPFFRPTCRSLAPWASPPLLPDLRSIPFLPFCLSHLTYKRPLLPSVFPLELTSFPPPPLLHSLSYSSDRQPLGSPSIPPPFKATAMSQPQPQLNNNHLASPAAEPNNVPMPVVTVVVVAVVVPPGPPQGTTAACAPCVQNGGAGRRIELLADSDKKAGP